MKQLSLSFAKLSSVYQKRREEFKQALERLKRKRNTDLYEKALQLFHKTEEQVQELNGEFALIANGPVNSSVQAKFKAFKKTYKELNEITKPEWRQWIESIIIALFLAIILRNFIFGLYHVPTGSAEPNILVGDRIWGNKMAYYFGDVKHDDRVIFDNPEFVYDSSNPIKLFWQKYVGFPIPLLGLEAGPDNWVKHVIGVPGDVIEGRIEDGKTVVYRNGVKLEEPYVNPYPLIRLRKTVGFVPFEHIGPLSIPMFLRKIEKDVNYTYDPSKPFDNQPFYTISEEEIVRDSNGDIMLAQPYSPTYRITRDVEQRKSLEDIQALMPSSSGDDYLVYTIDKFGPITVPDGKYWLMGDNRKGSYDSRSWGFLDKSRIHGRASFIIYSIDSEEPFWLFDFIKHPIEFLTKHIRYNRFFKRLT